METIVYLFQFGQFQTCWAYLIMAHVEKSILFFLDNWNLSFFW